MKRKTAENAESRHRCAWAGQDPLYVAYHDLEWGYPLRDDQKLFELLILEGAQAGLSWITILRKRERYRQVFDGFDAEKVARYDDRKIRDLLSDPGIVRNRLKIGAAIGNAQAYLRVLEKRGSFSEFLWRFVDGAPIQNRWKGLTELPAKTPKSVVMSKELAKSGFRFVGPTICYAFMQAAGLVNDHVVGCFRHAECAAAGARMGRQVR